MLDHWPLVGRDDELAELTARLSTPDCRGIVLAGRPGVGKSRLAREATGRLAEAGWVVRSATATASARSTPLSTFAPWTDDVEGAPLIQAQRLVAALTAAAGPGRLLVSIDDAHLLDDLSAVVLQQLVLTGTATVLVTTRTGEPAPDAVRMLWKDGLLQRRELGPLSSGCTEELLTAVFGAPPDRPCAARLWQLAAGNALFLRQIVEFESGSDRLTVRDGAVRWSDTDTDTDAVAPSLVELVDVQIGAVRDAVLDVVDVVAVGEPLERRCLRLVADQEAIEEAEARELIHTEGDLVCMGHPVYGEVRRKRCGPWRLRRLRGQVALAMEDGTRGAARTVRRGLLWLDSDLEPDADVLLSAAVAAGSLLDFELAHRLFTAADAADGSARARVPLAYNLFMMSRGELADEVLDTVEPADDRRTAYLNVVTVRAATLLWSRRSPDEAWQVIDDALETTRGAGRPNLLVSRAIQLSLAARPRDVLDLMATVDHRQLEPFAATIGLAAQCLAHGELGRPDEAAAKAAECGRVVGLNEQGRFLGLHLAEFLTFALATAGRIAEAVDVADRHLRAHHDQPASARAVAEEILGMALLAAGDLDGARRHLPGRLDGHTPDDAVTASFHVATSFHRFQPLRAQALARSGDVAGARSALAAAMDDHHPAYVYVTTSELLAEAWVAAAAHRSTEARQAARRAAAFARDHDQLAREVWCLQTAVQLGDTGCADRLAELAEAVAGPRVVTAGRYAPAVAADDPEGLDRVSGEFETMGDVLAAADAAGHAAVSYRRRGRAGRAMTAAARAHRLVAACGGAASPAVTAAALTLPFTQREREIAVLVAQGMSNRGIADAVSLSVRTVESHVYNASSKAGVTSRAALAEVVRAVLPVTSTSPR